METKMFMVNSNLNTIGGELDELQPEIMQHSVFRSLRKCGWREVPWKRYVVLSFDLVACEDLNPNLTARELEQLPPFVMLFGIQIINTKKFQPIGRIFCRRSAHTLKIATCIKSFIQDLMRCEYFVVATVCKPLGFLRKIVNCLVENESLSGTSAAQLYRVEYLKIVHFYDPITMLVHTFLMFLKYDMGYIQNNKEFVASYDDCKKVMLISSEKDVINNVFKHTSNTLCALKLFSMTFYRTVQTCIVKGKLKDIGTAEFIALFDMIFDTLHGDTTEYTSKINRNFLTKTSCHMRIWSKFSPILQSMKVIHTKKENGIDMRNKCVPPNLNGKHSLLSTGPLGTEETKRKLRQRIKELQGKTEEICENKENSTSLGGIEINSYDDKESLEQSVQVIDNSKAMKITENEFNNDGDFYTTIDNLSYTVEDTTANIEAHEQENAIGFETFGSDVFADYSKKLYLILEESECTDIRKFDDYGCKSLIEDKYIETSQNYLQLPDETLMKQYGWLAHFVIRHFDTYLDYLEYFVDDTCIYKKTNCIKILLHQGTIEYAENYHSEDDYYNEDEITYSNETIIGHAPEIYADLLPDPAENEGNKGVVVTNEVETLEKSTKTESSIEDNNKIDTLLSNEYLSKSPFNIATIQDIFSAFTYINEHLKSNKNGEDIIADVVSYLRNFNSFNLRLVLNSNDIKHQAYAIYECIIRMLTILALNKATAAEQQEAYEKSADIQRQLKILVNRDKKPKVLESKKEVAVDSIPSFFGNTIKAPIIKDKEAPDEHVNLKDIHDATEKTYSVKEAKAFEKVQECILMEVDSEGDDKASTKEEPKSFRRENTQPFIFDAWQISINGAKKLFEFLQKKRFTSLDMNCINMDHIAQIISKIRTDHGVTTESKHNININFIDANIVCEVFETDGALIFE